MATIEENRQQELAPTKPPKILDASLSEWLLTSILKCYIIRIENDTMISFSARPEFVILIMMA
jgi:hypothetical protein